MPNQHTKRPRTALQRFAENCAFDPVTGCVMWTGGTSSGRGHNEPYGRFWYENFMWYAHRWSALHIHGMDITGFQVDHCCPAGPSTLCVQHVKPESAEVNRLLQNIRPGRAFQDIATKKYWLFVGKGIIEYEERPRLDTGVPFHLPPAWLSPYLPKSELDNECPF